MKASISILVSAIGMLACSTQQPSPSPPAVLVQIPYFNVEPAPEYPTDAPGFSVCKLGSSCLALDPRPFETCLLATNRCSDKIIEPLLVVVEPEPAR